ncbi:hypothetical protein J6Z19_08685 [bacterium]|nr:hypothetical protein [bacterium]
MKSIKPGKIPESLFFIFLFMVILSRVYLETEVFARTPFFSYFVATHHSMWFTFVFFYFALCARYILGLKVDKIQYLALLSPIIYIPLVHAWIEGTPIKLQYLRGDFSKALLDILTLYRFSTQDSYFFFEMIALLIAFAVLSYIVSRSILRTFLNIIIGFYGSMFLAGMQLFGVAPHTKAYFPINTIFKNHIFLSLVYFTAAVIAFSICFMPEIIELFKRNKKLLLAALCAGLIISLNILGFLQKQPNIADFILLSVVCTTTVVSAVLLHEGTNLPGNRFFPLFFGTVSLIISLGIIFVKRVLL